MQHRNGMRIDYYSGVLQLRVPSLLLEQVHMSQQESASWANQVSCWINQHNYWLGLIKAPRRRCTRGDRHLDFFKNPCGPAGGQGPVSICRISITYRYRDIDASVEIFDIYRYGHRYITYYITYRQVLIDMASGAFICIDMWFEISLFLNIDTCVVLIGNEISFRCLSGCDDSFKSDCGAH